MKRKMIAACLVMILSAIAGVLVIHDIDTKVNGQTTSMPEENLNADEVKPTSPSQDLPDRVFFDMLFNTVLSMEKAAENLRSEGKSGDIWDGYFERRASLIKPQASELRKVAAKFEREISPIQIRAFEVISERRAARARGEKASPVSEELHLLQSKRDALSLRYGADLQRRLGLPVVDRLREAIKQTASDLPGIPDADRRELMERSRELRHEMDKSGTQGGRKQ